MRTIDLPTEGLDTLFGPHDANLKHIESLLDVRLRTHGYTLIADGESEAEGRVEVIFERLRNL